MDTVTGREQWNAWGQADLSPMGEVSSHNRAQKETDGAQGLWMWRVSLCPCAGCGLGEEDSAAGLREAVEREGRMLLWFVSQMLL